MAEASTSQASCTITLTYAPRDDLADKVLYSRHFQMFIKQLRNAGHKVRYLVAGEYGDLKGRAHFHAVLFFSYLRPRTVDDAEYFGPVPYYNSKHLFAPEESGRFCSDIPHKQMVHLREWPHGHVTVDWSASEQSAKYVCKYLLADNKQNAWFSLSKKPALGAAFFASKAAKAASLDVLPSSFNYLPPGGSDERRYMMTGATRRDYLNAITTNAADKARMNEWVIKSFEKFERKRVLDAIEALPIEVQEQSFFDLRERMADLQAASSRRKRQFIDDWLAERLESDGFVYVKDIPNGS